jgi:hypothetical protein
MMNPTAAGLPIPELPQTPSQESPITRLPLFELTEEDVAILRSALPDSAKPREGDCLAYWRELPRLLADGHASRFALLEGGRVVSIWDTHSDAVQAGYDKFGYDRPFMTPQIEQRDLDRLQQYLIQERAKRCSR